MDITTVRIGVTLISFVVFLGILGWAWSKRNQDHRLPIERLRPAKAHRG